MGLIAAGVDRKLSAATDSRRSSAMRKLAIIIGMFAGTLLTAASGFGQGDNQGQGQAVVTVLPAHDGEVPANLSQQDLNVKINGKEATIKNWIPFRGPNDKLELVVTVWPAHDGEVPANLSQQDLNVKINGKEATIKNWIPFRGPNDKLELVVMIDGSARSEEIGRAHV